MIARIDSTGLQPLEIAGKFALLCFDEPRKVDVSTFYGEHSWMGYAGSFGLLEGMGRYGIRWFKRRGRVFAFYTRMELLVRVGALHARRGHNADRRGDSPEERVSYLDGYLSGIPRITRPDQLRAIETNIYTEIESLLY